MLDNSTLRIGNHVKTDEGYWQVVNLVPRPDNPSIVQVGLRQVSGNTEPRYTGGEVPVDEIPLTPQSLSDFGFNQLFRETYGISTPTGFDVEVTLHAVGGVTVDINSLRQPNLAENNIHHLQNLIQDITGHAITP